MTGCFRIIFKTNECNCATKIIIIIVIGNLKLKYIVFFKPAFIKVARTTKLCHHPVCLLCQTTACMLKYC